MIKRHKIRKPREKIDKIRWERRIHPMYYDKLKYPERTRNLLPKYIWRWGPYTIIDKCYLHNEQFLVSCFYSHFKDTYTDTLREAKALVKARDRKARYYKHYKKKCLINGININK